MDATAVSSSRLRADRAVLRSYEDTPQALFVDLQIGLSWRREPLILQNAWSGARTSAGGGVAHGRYGGFLVQAGGLSQVLQVGLQLPADGLSVRAKEALGAGICAQFDRWAGGRGAAPAGGDGPADDSPDQRRGPRSHGQRHKKRKLGTYSSSEGRTTRVAPSGFLGQTLKGWVSE